MRQIRRCAAFSISFVLALTICVEIPATQTMTYLNTQVTVNEVFTLSSDFLNLDFGKNDPGRTTQVKELNLRCKTNKNVPWEVSIGVDYPLTSSQFGIPNENFRWQIVSIEGGGTSNQGTGSLSTVPHVFYSSSTHEYITYSPVEITLQFYVDIPENQPSGIYDGTIYVKMRDLNDDKSSYVGISVSLEVNPKFTISGEPSSLDFGVVYPGTTTQPKELNLSFTTNANRPWSAKLHAISELTSGMYTIPNSNFSWQITQTGYGTQTEDGTSPISTIPVTFYVAQPGEYITYSPVGVSLSFVLDMPETQTPGSYTATLVITATE